MFFSNVNVFTQPGNFTHSAVGNPRAWRMWCIIMCVMLCATMEVIVVLMFHCGGFDVNITVCYHHLNDSLSFKWNTPYISLQPRGASLWFHRRGKKNPSSFLSVTLLALSCTHIHQWLKIARCRTTIPIMLGSFPIVRHSIRTNNCNEYLQKWRSLKRTTVKPLHQLVFYLFSIIA